MKISIATAAIVLTALVVLTLPPVPLALSPSSDGTVRGNLHVHSLRSDGSSGLDDIATAAARAGLAFLVLTDHGDGTRPPDPPVYRSGVLCLDGVEISTTGGHYAVIGLPQAPYPLAGEPREVVEDVQRLGGFGIVAHPDSPKADLAWQDWTLPFDALEWINQDTGWRVHAAGGWRARAALFAAVLDYPFRPREALAGLLTTSAVTAREWSRDAEHRRVVILAGTDAHAKLALRNTEPGDNRWSLPLPAYEASFSSFSVHVKTARPLTGDAATDAALVTQAIRGGHLYTAVDGYATPPSFEFEASNGTERAQEGDEMPAGQPISLHVRSNAPGAFTTTLWRGDARLATHHGGDWSLPVGPDAAVYRVEIDTGDTVPARTWLLSNPIYVRASAAPRDVVAERLPVSASRSLMDSAAAGGWHVETDPASIGVFEPAGQAGHADMSLRFVLSSHPTGSRTAAMVWPAAPGVLAGYDRVVVAGRADGPMRVSIQIRADDADGQPRRRWQQSVYLDSAARSYSLAFDDFAPVPGPMPVGAPLRHGNALMLVVDGTHATPGMAGQFWIDAIALEK